MLDPLSKKQLEFIIHSQAHWNLAHGSVRSGKTVGTLFRFMQAVEQCPDSAIWMVGHSSDTIYQNAIRLLLESEQLAIFRPFCNWFAGKRQLKFRDKTINTLGAKDEGAIGSFQGKTFSLVYCDELTLYPESIIDMIDTRLSKSHSMGFASMNPSHPDHKVKKWIDKANAGDKNYYSLHFTLDDNPYVDEQYKQRIRDSLSGLFYKRNYLGLWCLAEGAIFDFFDPKIHVVERPPASAEYWIAAIDYGAVNPFACVLLGISTGRYSQMGKRIWVEKEYYWDPKKEGMQKTNSEFAQDVYDMIQDYSVKAIYCDPSAEAFQHEMRKRGMHVVDANNDVENGIGIMTSEMKKGNLYVMSECKNLIREIQSYSWDSKKSERGYDEPVKKDDHAVDALRYAIASHKVPTYQPYKEDQEQQIGFNGSRYRPTRRHI
jgi:PBSX family phage terminase large subunit